MTPEMAVLKLVEIMSVLPELSGKIIYDAMGDANIPALQGHLAFLFTQNAWGQASLANSGIKMCDEYYILDVDGKVLETGLSSQNPYFTTARDLAPQYRNTAPFKYMTITSSIVRTVNASIENGSKIENLIMMPDILFLGSPTEEGHKVLQKLMSDYAEKLKQLYPRPGKSTLQ